MKSADKDAASHKSSGSGTPCGLPCLPACGSLGQAVLLLLLALLLLSLALLLPKQDIICSRQNFINARLASLPASQQQTAVAQWSKSQVLATQNENFLTSLCVVF